MHKGFSAEPNELRSWGKVSVVLFCGHYLGPFVALSIFILLVVCIFFCCLVDNFLDPHILP